MIDKTIMNKYEVSQDVLQEDLKELSGERVLVHLNAKLVFEEEQLQKLEPHLNSIEEFSLKYSEYKEKLKQFGQVLQAMQDMREVI